MTDAETALESSCMAEDDDQRQVERMTSRTTFEVENEIPCPENRRWTLVNHRSSHGQFTRPETQSVSTTGGRTASSHSWSGWDHQAQEPDPE